SPDQQIVSVAFALRAETANSAASIPATGISGTLSTTQVPALDASKITTGTLNAARVPNLSAAILTSGTLDPARLPANIALKNPDNQNATAAFGILRPQDNALSAYVE